MSKTLLVIDVQNDFCPGGALAVSEGDQIIPAINRLMVGYDRVILTQDWHPKGHSSFASSHNSKAPLDMVEMPYGPQVLWPDHCVQGSKGAAFHPDLQADRAALQQMIADLVQATTMANGAIKGLRETAVEADERLNTRLNEAERFAIELANHVNAGQAVMERIAKITQAARAPGDGGEGSRAGSALKALKDHQKRREHAA